MLIPRRYKDQVVEVIAVGEKNEYSNSYEVWINAIKVNGKEVSLKDLDLKNNWEYKEGNLLSDAGENRNMLPIYVNEMQEIEIVFGMHNWSGIVEIKSENTIDRIDLYSSNSTKKDICITGRLETINLRTICLFLGSYLSIFPFVSLLFFICNWKKVLNKMYNVS